jgi:hypothetical protein
MAQYNTPAWRAAVTCQEIGHDYGPRHQDEDFNTDATNSCMEYTNVPAGNEHPTSTITISSSRSTTHVDVATTTAASAQALGNTMSDWGRPAGRDKHGRVNEFVRDLGNGNTVVTHVTWVPGYHPETVTPTSISARPFGPHWTKTPLRPRGRGGFSLPAVISVAELHPN